jgi:hypothetical protein
MAQIHSAVGPGDLEHGVGRCVAAEAEDEAAGLGDADPPAVQGHLGARRGLPEHQAALQEVALEPQLRGACRGAGQCERQQGQDSE